MAAYKGLLASVTLISKQIVLPILINNLTKLKKLQKHQL